MFAARVTTLELSEADLARQSGIRITSFVSFSLSLKSLLSGGTNLGSLLVPMGVLAGDVGGNGTASASDVSQAKLQSGQALSGSNFRSDITVNGSIKAMDISGIKANSDTALP